VVPGVLVLVLAAVCEEYSIRGRERQVVDGGVTDELRRSSRLGWVFGLRDARGVVCSSAHIAGSGRVR
jgi:hypothetical protein